MFDEKIDVNAILRIVHDRGGVVVRGYQGKVEFAAVVQEIIDQDRGVFDQDRGKQNVFDQDRGKQRKTERV